MPNGRGSRVFSQIKYLVYIMSWAHGAGTASVSLETHNSFVPGHSPGMTKDMRPKDFQALKASEFANSVSSF